MDWQILFNLVSGVLLVGIGWWCREIWDSVRRLKEDLKKIEVDMPTNYVRKVDIDARLDKIDSVLERIFDKLDEKADKQ